MDTCTYVSAGDDLLNYGERERDKSIHTIVHSSMNHSRLTEIIPVTNRRLQRQLEQNKGETPTER